MDRWWNFPVRQPENAVAHVVALAANEWGLAGVKLQKLTVKKAGRWGNLHHVSMEGTSLVPFNSRKDSDEYNRVVLGLDTEPEEE